MKMDENVNPAWIRQCQGSMSGRMALQEIERLRAELKQLAEGNIERWEKSCAAANEIERLRAEVGELKRKLCPNSHRGDWCECGWKK